VAALEQSRKPLRSSLPVAAYFQNMAKQQRRRTGDAQRSDYGRKMLLYFTPNLLAVGSFFPLLAVQKHNLNVGFSSRSFIKTSFLIALSLSF